MPPIDTENSSVVDALVAALTPEQMLTGIGAALKSRELEHVLIYLAALVRVDPAKAALINDAINLRAAMGEGKR